MVRVESGRDREFFPGEVLQALGVMCDPDRLQALANMPSSSLRVLASLRPAVRSVGEPAGSTDHNPLPPAA